MNTQDLLRELKNSLRHIAEDYIHQAHGAIDIDEAVHKTLHDDESIKAIDSEVIIEAALRAAFESVIEDLSRPVSAKKGETANLFPLEWFEHGIRFDGHMFVKNRYAGRPHNRKRIDNVDSNLQRVILSADTERRRFELLEFAYESDDLILNNEDAFRWLVANGYGPRIAQAAGSVSQQVHPT